MVKRERIVEFIVTKMPILVVVTFAVAISLFLILYIDISAIAFDQLAIILAVCTLVPLIYFSIPGVLFSFLIFVVFFPVLHQSRNYITYVLSDTFPLNIVTVYPLLLLPFLFLWCKDIRFGSIEKLFFVFVFATLPSVLFAYNKPLALTGFYLEIFLPFSIYLILYLIRKNYKRRTLDLLLIFSFSHVIAVGYALLEFARSGFNIEIASQRSIGEGANFYSLTGGYGEPVALGIIFIIFWPLYFLVDERNKGKRIFYRVLSILMLTISLATISRRVLLFFFLQLLLFLYISRRNFIIPFLKILVPIFLLLLLVMPFYISRTFGADASVLMDWGNFKVDLNIIYYIKESFSTLSLLFSHPLGIGGLNGNYYWPGMNISEHFGGWSNPVLRTYFIPFSSLWIHYGIIPFSIFVFMLLNMMRWLRKVSKHGNMHLKGEATGLLLSLIPGSILSLLSMNVSWRGNVENIVYPDMTQPGVMFGVWTAVFLFLCVDNYRKHMSAYRISKAQGDSATLS